jgi:hypothetical protein
MRAGPSVSFPLILEPSLGSVYYPFGPDLTMRRNRCRGLAKARFQNLFIATACNIKRWLKLEGVNRDQNASYSRQKPSERTFSALRGSISSFEGLATLHNVIYKGCYFNSQFARKCRVLQRNLDATLYCDSAVASSCESSDFRRGSLSRHCRSVAQVLNLLSGGEPSCTPFCRASNAAFKSSAR